MKQFILVAAPVYNNTKLNTPAFTKQIFPKCQVEWNTMHPIDSLKKEGKRKVCRAELLVNKNLSCTRIKFSISKFLVWHDVEIVVF